MLQIKNLKASIEEKQILKGLNLNIKPGEVHAIMGPNGSGKSTLASVLAAKPGYEVTDGKVLFEGENIKEWDATERALRGIFLAFQYPVEIPGVNNLYFLKEAKNAHLKFENKPELDTATFLKQVREKIKTVGLGAEFLKRSLNEGFSGGEKKRNEILQMAVLEPKLAVLDETDSGLDIDALKIVADGVNRLRDGKRSFLVITHYQRLLDYIVPDYVHVLSDGQIVHSGDKSLALTLEEKGYSWLHKEPEVGEGL